MKDLIKQILMQIGEDPSREGLQNTPERVEKSLKFLTSGYWVNIEELVNGALFQEEYDEMVIVKDIDLFSMCEHHMLPFIGKCHVAYLPKGKIIGISKVPRIVDAFSRRLQVQERLTSQVADAICHTLNPSGVAVELEAEHLCMSMRGIQKPGNRVITTAIRGPFANGGLDREGLLALLKRR